MWEEECGKDGAEVEILEKDSTQGWGRAGLGHKGAWLGLGALGLGCVQQASPCSKMLCGPRSGQ